VKKWKLNKSKIDGTYSQSTVKDIHGALKATSDFSYGWTPILLGSNQGSNPVEYLLAALSGCITTSIVAHSSAKGIKIRSIEAMYEGDIDLQGFLGLSDEVPVGYQEIRLFFKIDADVSNQEKEKMLRMGQKYSPVFNTITKSAQVSVHLESWK
jgi:uncharacterized OsmC-like protein